MNNSYAIKKHKWEDVVVPKAPWKQYHDFFCLKWGRGGDLQGYSKSMQLCNKPFY